MTPVILTSPVCEVASFYRDPQMGASGWYFDGDGKTVSPMPGAVVQLPPGGREWYEITRRELASIDGVPRLTFTVRHYGANVGLVDARPMPERRTVTLECSEFDLVHLECAADAVSAVSAGYLEVQVRQFAQRLRGALYG